MENYTGTHSRFREIYWEDEDEAGPSNMGGNSTIRCFKKITIMGSNLAAERHQRVIGGNRHDSVKKFFKIKRITAII